MKVADFRPASSPGEASAISTSKPRRSAQRRYMRRRISAQSWESVPPAPAWTVTTASPESYSPLKRRASSSSASRDSTAASWPSVRPPSRSSSGQLGEVAEFADVGLQRRGRSSAGARRERGRQRCEPRSPGRPRSRAAHLRLQPRGLPLLGRAGSKVVREQGQLLADSGEPRRYGLFLRRPLPSAQLPSASARSSKGRQQRIRCSCSSKDQAISSSPASDLVLVPVPATAGSAPPLARSPRRAPPARSSAAPRRSAASPRSAPRRGPSAVPSSSAARPPGRAPRRTRRGRAR